MACIGMMAGFFVCRWATKPKTKVILVDPAIPPSPRKPENSGSRTGFQREPPAVKEAIIHLQQGQVKAAVALLEKLPETIAGSVPESAARSILITTMRTPKLGAMMLDLEPLRGKITSGSLDAFITDAAEKKDASACRLLDGVAVTLQIPKSQVTFEALAKAYAFDAGSLRELVRQAEAPLARPFAKIVVQACTVIKDFKIAAEVIDKANAADVTYLRSVIGKPSDTAAKSHSSPSTSACSDVSSAPTSPRSSATSEESSSSVKETPSNTKAPATKSPTNKLAEEELGTTASYNGLLNTKVDADDLRGAWRLVADMQVNGISPNPMTCSIMLKSKVASVEEVSRVLLLVDTINDPMDDTFFTNLTEACIRVGRLDVLSKHFTAIHNKGRAGNLCAQTYGAMIMAYGRAHDMKRVWEVWDTMLNHKIKLTSFTVGPMVEALVANGLTKEAWRLVQDLRKEDSAKPLLDTAIYSIILKGFASAEAIEKVLAFYTEMKAHQVQPDTMTYNTILHAFAQSGMMQHVAPVLNDMKSSCPPIEPDVVTYNALVKGYCNASDLDRALRIFKDMQFEGKCLPDEVMFNSLLIGCAKESRPDEALELLSDMKKSCVAPSNNTLSMLVKLMGRCGRLDQAFAMLEGISKEPNSKINIEVYTCFIQSCFHNGQAGKAIALYEQIIREGRIHPDAMAYTALVRGCLRLGIIDKATYFVRCAYGIGMSDNASPGLNNGCLDEVVQALGGVDSEQGVALTSELRS